MEKKYDHREMEYYDFVFRQRQIEDPDYYEKIKKLVIAKAIHTKYEEDKELILTNLKIRIPTFHIDVMSDIYKREKDGFLSKYGLYRKYEDYLVKTAWFQKLDPKLKVIIRLDFYKTIVLGIHNSLNLISRFNGK